MEKKAVSGIMLTLLLTSMLTLAFNIQPVKAGTIIVPDDYPTIQGAINAANMGDIIEVKSGTYYENVVIEKSISLIGENSNTVFVDGSLKATVVEIYADNVVIRGFTIRNGGPTSPYLGEGSGIKLHGSSRCNIANNNIINNNYGVTIYGSLSNNVFGNTITNNNHGIIAYCSSDNRIIENTIANNGHDGIHFSFSPDNIATQNTIAGNTYGIYLAYSSKNSISENTVTNNIADGLAIYDSLSNGVFRNMIRGNRDGIHLCNSSSNSIFQNEIANNHWIGISLSSSTLVTDGSVFVGNSTNNNIFGNSILANNFFGVYLAGSPSNIIYHNSFVYNTNQAYSTNSVNVWDDGYPSGGNYWSDYRERYPDAKEIDGSGIWDTPYVIDDYNRDRYPLMNPWTPTPPPAIRYVITTDTIKVRAYPGKPDDGNVITMLRKGSVLQIVEHIDNGKYADGYHWWYVKFGTGSTDGVLRGWVAGEFLGEYEFPKEPKERKSVRFTAYNVALESEFIEKIAKEYPEKFDPTGTKEVKVKIYDPYWKYIGEESRTYNRAFLYSDLGVSMEGSGRDAEGRLIKCRAKVPDAFTWKERWILEEEKVEFFELRVWPLFPWDASNGQFGYLSPWYSIAVKGVVPEGSIVYVPQLAGRRLSSGAVLGGYFVAVDTGNLKEDQIDVFVGAGETAIKDWYKIIGELGDRFDIKYHEIRWPLIRAKLESYGELRVYDSHGRVTGLVNGKIKTEIPDSSYDYIDNAVTTVFPTDSYWYAVAGTGEGLYGLTVSTVTEQEIITFAAVSIPTSANIMHQYTIDWDALSRGEEGVTVQIDSNGDGIFEQTITADSELTHDEFMLQTATVIDFDPDTLNLGSKGKWVTVYIELPEGYDVSQIDVSSIRLNGTVPALAKPTEIGDYDGDGIPDLMVKFDRVSVIALFAGKMVPGNYVMEVTGTVAGIRFKGTDTIRVI